LIHDPIKARLLEAAGEEFAAHGFEGATVRSICRRAKTKNIAAVNYYFKDKEHLYESALLEAHACSKDGLEYVNGEGMTPDQRLRAFVGGFLAQTRGGEHRNGWHDALMLREMIQPSAAGADALVRNAIGPRFAFLKATLRELHPDGDEDSLHALAFSVVGQCLHYKVGRSISVRLIGEDAYNRLSVEYLTDHIVTMTLAALGHAPPLSERAGASCGKGGG
jgi:AcrR family transcriptional regulator